MQQLSTSPAAAPATQLEEFEPSPVSERRVVTTSGASASVHEQDGRERIEVRDAAARLLFELDPLSGRMQVSAPSGDLALCAKGDVEIIAGGALRCRAQEVQLEAGEGEERAALTLGKGVAGLSSRALELAADTAQFAFVEASCRSERFRARVGEAKLVLTRLETITDRLFEQARSVFRQVEDLHQLRAGRSRTLVTGAYSVKSGHASIEADADVRIDGTKIHLG